MTSELSAKLSDVEANRALARASAPQQALEQAARDGRVSMVAMLEAFGFDPTKPTHQAALMAAEKYALDPLLRHIIVIQGSGAYITRDGWLHIAHRSGAFDGMVTLEAGDAADTAPNKRDGYWWSRVAVYRKDMSHPFTYIGRYPHNGQNARYGPEMAVKVAEVAALRRAFPVSGVPAYEETWEGHAVQSGGAPDVMPELAEPEQDWQQLSIDDLGSDTEPAADEPAAE